MLKHSFTVSTTTSLININKSPSHHSNSTQTPRKFSNKTSRRGLSSRSPHCNLKLTAKKHVSTTSSIHLPNAQSKCPLPFPKPTQRALLTSSFCHISTKSSPQPSPYTSSSPNITSSFHHLSSYLPPFALNVSLPTQVRSIFHLSRPKLFNQRESYTLGPIPPVSIVPTGDLQTIEQQFRQIHQYTPGDPKSSQPQSEPASGLFSVKELTRHRAAQGEAPTQELKFRHALGGILKYVWVKGQTKTKTRVVCAVLCLLIGKIFSITQPLIFRDAIDHIAEQSPQSKDWSKHGAPALVVDSPAPIQELPAEHLVQAIAQLLEDLTFVNHEDWKALPIALLLTYGGLRVGSVLFSELRNIIFSHVVSHSVSEVSTSLVTRLLTLDRTFHIARDTPALCKTIDRGIHAHRVVLSCIAFEFVPSLIELTLTTLLLSQTFGYDHAGIAAACIFFYCLYTVRIIRWRGKYRRAFNAADNTVTRLEDDFLINWRTSQSLNNIYYLQHLYSNAVHRLTDAYNKTILSSAILRAGQVSIFTFWMTTAMVYSIYQLQTHQFTLGEFVALHGFFINLMHQIRSLSASYGTLKAAVLDSQPTLSLENLHSHLYCPPNPIKLLIRHPTAKRLTSLHIPKPQQSLYHIFKGRRELVVDYSAVPSFFRPIPSSFDPTTGFPVIDTLDSHQSQGSDKAKLNQNKYSNPIIYHDGHYNSIPFYFPDERTAELNRSGRGELVQYSFTQQEPYFPRFLPSNFSFDTYQFPTQSSSDTEHSSQPSTQATSFSDSQPDQDDQNEQLSRLHPSFFRHANTLLEEEGGKYGEQVLQSIAQHGSFFLSMPSSPPSTISSPQQQQQQQQQQQPQQQHPTQDQQLSLNTMHRSFSTEQVSNPNNNPPQGGITISLVPAIDSPFPARIGSTNEQHRRNLIELYHLIQPTFRPSYRVPKSFRNTTTDTTFATTFTTTSTTTPSTFYTTNSINLPSIITPPPPFVAKLKKYTIPTKTSPEVTSSIADSPTSSKDQNPKLIASPQSPAKAFALSISTSSPTLTPSTTPKSLTTRSPLTTSTSTPSKHKIPAFKPQLISKKAIELFDSFNETTDDDIGMLTDEEELVSKNTVQVNQLQHLKDNIPTLEQTMSNTPYHHLQRYRSIDGKRFEQERLRKFSESTNANLFAHNWLDTVDESASSLSERSKTAESLLLGQVTNDSTLVRGLDGTHYELQPPKENKFETTPVAKALTSFSESMRKMKTSLLYQSVNDVLQHQFSHDPALNITASDAPESTILPTINPTKLNANNSELPPGVGCDQKTFVPPDENTFLDVTDGIAYSLHNVTLYQSHTNIVLLDNVSLDIPKNSFVAIVGAQRSGKSQILNLLARELDPTDGFVYLNDVNIKNIRLGDIHGVTGKVEGETLLFNLSAFDNILLANRYATNFEVISAMKKAKIPPALIPSQAMLSQYPRMPGELALLAQTVGEKGGTFIKQQTKSRIALARMMLKSPKTFLIDDFSSDTSIDSHSIFKTLIYDNTLNITPTIQPTDPYGHKNPSTSAKQRDKTIVLVTHNLNHITDADLIYVMDAGKLVETGTHHNLLAKNGHYSRLWADTYHDKTLFNDQSAPFVH